MQTIPSDQDARTQALDITKSFIVQAPAGSGKTELLTQRILKLLSVSETPENILAITFTRKAANEMRQRIINLLEQVEHLQNTLPQDKLLKKIQAYKSNEKINFELASSVLEQSDKLNWDLLKNPNRLQLKTIDSFCSQITFQVPLLSELGGSTQIYENPEELYSEASQSFIATLEENMQWSAALSRVLAYLDKRTDHLETLFIELLAKRLQWAPIIIEFRAKAARHSIVIMKNELEYCTREIILNKLDLMYKHPFFSKLLKEVNSLQPFLTKNIDKEKNLRQLQPIEITKSPNTEFLQNLLLLKELLFTQNNTIRESVDKRIGFPADKNDLAITNKQRMLQLLEEFKNHMDLVKHISELDTLPPLYISEEQIEICTDICNCLYFLLGYLHLTFQKYQALDFNEVQLKALQVLNPEIQNQNNAYDISLSLNSKINHILVDEYQDTSTAQLRLLKYLTLDWNHQNDGKTLFLVGDPMQSIYRFREADVSIFLEAQQSGLNQISLQPLVLNCNFRSGNHLVNWINYHFSKSFPQYSNAKNGAVSYSHSVSYNSDLISNVYCNIERIPPEMDESDELQEQSICDEILNIQSLTPNDTIAVLAQTRSHIQKLIEQFKKKNIIYSAVDIDLLSEKPYINSLFNLSSALIDPFDDLSWFGLLRSSLIGLENKHLLDLKQHLEQNDLTISQLFINKTPDLLNTYFRVSTFSDQSNIALLRFYNTISHAYEQVHSYGILPTIEQTWLTLGGPATITISQQQDCYRFFELLHKLESDYQSLNSRLIKKHLAKLYANPQISITNPVQIMTIHKSKGLEFDHVFLTGLHTDSGNDKGNLFNWDIYHSNDSKDYLLIAPQKPAHIKPTTSNLYDYLNENSKQKVKNEAIRLLYVACTRAKKQLFLYGAIKQKREKNLVADKAPNKGTLLSLIYDEINPEEIRFIEHINNNNSIKNTNQDSYSLDRLAFSWKNIPELQYQDTDSKTFKRNASGNHVSSIFLKNESSENQDEESLNAKTLGILVHFGLQILVKNRLNASRIFNNLTRDKNFIALAKSSDIFKTEALQQILLECKVILQNILIQHEDDWIFDNALEQSACELALMYLDENERLKHSYIDRSFIKNKTRWIIDYKNSQPEIGQSLDEFFKQEADKYQQQLSHYSTLFKRMEDLPQQLALYFPRLRKLYLLN